jgi:hypothetical protein
MRNIGNVILIGFLAACVMSASSAQTNRTGEKKSSANSTPTKNFGSNRRQKISKKKYSFVLSEQNLALTIQAAGKEIGANWALMNGIEVTPFTGLTIKNATEEEISEKIAVQAKLETQLIGSYRFFYPKEYIDLLPTNDADSEWSTKYSKNKIGLAFGADTPLSSILATLGQSLEMTFVADQTISDSLSGEISFKNISIQDALSGVLLSARIPLDSILFEHSDEYVFIHSVRNPARPNYQIAPPNAQNQQKLAKLCTINLAHVIVDESGANARYRKLSEVAQQISEQINIPIDYDPALKDFPITPMYIHETTRQHALELLLRQWPVPQFGYSFQGDKIYLGRF